MKNTLKMFGVAIATIVFMFMVALPMSAGLAGCKPKEEAKQKIRQKELSNRQYRENYYKRIVANSIWYVYDPKVEICYAITEIQGTSMAIRTMTVVPYEKVKKYALVIEYDGMSGEDWKRHHNSSPE